MSEKNLLGDQANVKALAERLSQCPEVTKYDHAEEKEAGVLAHSFSDLEESFRTFLTKQLPQLMNHELSPSELFDVLIDIGEEFRHILYHIRDPKFYGYLNNQHDGDG